MFRDWGFLLGEIWILLILVALIGLLAGWIIWGRRGATQGVGDTVQLRDDLEQCRAMHVDKDARIKTLEGESAAKSATPAVATDTPTIAPPAEPDFDGDGVVEGTDEAVKPATLTAARDGVADDLKRIKGIGSKLEKLCNKLGFYHFDQIAAWTVDEKAWVDANLEGFKGRVTRDTWIEQATLLAQGGDTAFSKK